jgi:hypothetical protein
VSLTPEIKMDVLLGRSSAGKQVLATWAFRVVPYVLSLRDLDMSRDMRLLDVLVERKGSETSESKGRCLREPLGSRGATSLAYTPINVTPSSGDRSYRLQAAAIRP